MATFEKRMTSLPMVVVSLSGSNQRVTILCAQNISCAIDVIFVSNMRLGTTCSEMEFYDVTFKSTVTTFTVWLFFNI